METKKIGLIFYAILMLAYGVYQAVIAIVAYIEMSELT